MNEKIKVYDEKMSKTYEHLVADFMTIRAGRANPHVLDKLAVDYYGVMTPLQQVGNITVPEARIIQIAPWEKSLLRDIEKAILTSDLGINPSNDGTVIRLIFPQLTAETRKDLVKKVHAIAEDARVKMRNERRDALDQLKKINTTDKLSEDDVKNVEHDVQKMLDDYIGNIDSALAQKEKDILTI